MRKDIQRASIIAAILTFITVSFILKMNSQVVNVIDLPEEHGLIKAGDTLTIQLIHDTMEVRFYRSTVPTTAQLYIVR